jgi:ketosteroid isomerase-like protein
MRSDEDEVQAAEQELRVAMLSNDTAALTRLLHDQLVFVGPDGRVVGKADDLAAHRARRLRLTRLELAELAIKPDVDSDDVHTEALAVLAGTFDGAVCDGRYRYRRTWRKTAVGWQIIAGGVSPEPASSG